MCGGHTYTEVCSFPVDLESVLQFVKLTQDNFKTLTSASHKELGRTFVM